MTGLSSATCSLVSTDWAATYHHDLSSGKGVTSVYPLPGQRTLANQTGGLRGTNFFTSHEFQDGNRLYHTQADQPLLSHREPHSSLFDGTDHQPRYNAHNQLHSAKPQNNTIYPTPTEVEERYQFRPRRSTAVQQGYSSEAAPTTLRAFIEPLHTAAHNDKAQTISKWLSTIHPGAAGAGATPLMVASGNAVSRQDIDKRSHKQMLDQPSAHRQVSSDLYPGQNTQSGPTHLHKKEQYHSTIQRPDDQDVLSSESENVPVLRYESSKSTGRHHNVHRSHVADGSESAAPPHPSSKAAVPLESIILTAEPDDYYYAPSGTNEDGPCQRKSPPSEGEYKGFQNLSNFAEDPMLGKSEVYDAVVYGESELSDIQVDYGTGWQISLSGTVTMSGSPDDTEHSVVRGYLEAVEDHPIEHSLYMKVPHLGEQPSLNKDPGHPDYVAWKAIHDTASASRPSAAGPTVHIPTDVNKIMQQRRPHDKYPLQAAPEIPTSPVRLTAEAVSPDVEALPLTGPRSSRVNLPPAEAIMDKSPQGISRDLLTPKLKSSPSSAAASVSADRKSHQQIDSIKSALADTPSEANRMASPNPDHLDAPQPAQSEILAGARSTVELSHNPHHIGTADSFNRPEHPRDIAADSAKKSIAGKNTLPTPKRLRPGLNEDASDVRGTVAKLLTPVTVDSASTMSTAAASHAPSNGLKPSTPGPIVSILKPSGVRGTPAEERAISPGQKRRVIFDPGPPSTIEPEPEADTSASGTVVSAGGSRSSHEAKQISEPESGHSRNQHQSFTSPFDSVNKVNTAEGDLETESSSSEAHLTISAKQDPIPTVLTSTVKTPKRVSQHTAAIASLPMPTATAQTPRKPTSSTALSNHPTSRQLEAARPELQRRSAGISGLPASNLTQQHGLLQVPDTSKRTTVEETRDDESSLEQHKASTSARPHSVSSRVFKSTDNIKLHKSKPDLPQPTVVTDRAEKLFIPPSTIAEPRISRSGKHQYSEAPQQPIDTVQHDSSGDMGPSDHQQSRQGERLMPANEQDGFEGRLTAYQSPEGSNNRREENVWFPVKGIQMGGDFVYPNSGLRMPMPLPIKSLQGYAKRRVPIDQMVRGLQACRRTSIYLKGRNLLYKYHRDLEDLNVKRQQQWLPLIDNCIAFIERMTRDLTETNDMRDRWERGKYREILGDFPTPADDTIRAMFPVVLISMREGYEYTCEVRRIWQKLCMESDEYIQAKLKGEQLPAPLYRVFNSAWSGMLAVAHYFRWIEFDFRMVRQVLNGAFKQLEDDVMTGDSKLLARSAVRSSRTTQAALDSHNALKDDLVDWTGQFTGTLRGLQKNLSAKAFEEPLKYLRNLDRRWVEEEGNFGFLRSMFCLGICLPREARTRLRGWKFVDVAELDAQKKKEEEEAREKGVEPSRTPGRLARLSEQLRSCMAPVQKQLARCTSGQDDYAIEASDASDTHDQETGQAVQPPQDRRASLSPETGTPNNVTVQMRPFPIQRSISDNQAGSKVERSRNAELQEKLELAKQLEQNITEPGYRDCIIQTLSAYIHNLREMETYGGSRPERFKPLPDHRRARISSHHGDLEFPYLEKCLALLSESIANSYEAGLFFNSAMELYYSDVFAAVQAEQSRAASQAGSSHVR